MNTITIQGHAIGVERYVADEFNTAKCITIDGERIKGKFSKEETDDFRPVDIKTEIVWEVQKMLTRVLPKPASWDEATQVADLFCSTP